MTLIEEALALVAQGRDLDRAFRIIVPEYGPRLHRFVFNLCRDAALTGETVQETFKRAFLHVARYDPAKGTFLAWLTGIAEKELFHAWRRRRHDEETIRTLSICFDWTSPGPSEAVVEQASSDELWTWLRRLKFEDMLSEVLFDMEDKSYPEVARLIGRSVRTAQERHLRAVHVLRLEAEVDRMLKEVDACRS